MGAKYSINAFPQVLKNNQNKTECYCYNNILEKIKIRCTHY